MTELLSCHHGHALDVAELPRIARSLVCPYCGSITSFMPAEETKRAGSVDETIDFASQPDSQRPSGSKKAQASAKASTFVTMDLSEVSSGQSAPRDDQDEHFERPDLAGYQVLDELGRGGMGVVYRARNERLGRDVALKTLQRMSPEGLHRFKQEFRTLADIAHPNLASLYELLSDGRTWCFTMEILEGVEFLEYVWSGFEGLNSNRQHRWITDLTSSPRLTSERLQRLEEALRQLALGLNALHEAGVLHSDIKPSNVLMTQEGRLVLLDFGLAAEIRRHDTDEKRIVQGTPLYMAPEQAAGGPLSQASDWYAVGVILYEVLTGHFPFNGETVEILNRKQSETPLSPERLASDTPQHLNELCIALLDRNPEKRPAAVEVLRCVGADALADGVAARQRAEAIRPVQLVGRERHFEVLRESLAQVSDGSTRTVFVHGKSGMGKSVLVRSFLEGVQQRQEAVVLEGRCYEQESVPFKALDSLIDSLAVFLDTLPEPAVTGLMPRDRLALTQVFPVLGRAPELPKATYPSIQNADQQELRQRAMNALRELLQRLAIREPLVLYIDDLQWGDVDSAGLLADLVRPPEAPRMLLLVSYRSEDVQSSHCLQALAGAYNTGQYRPHSQELAVEALSRDESTQLASMLLGRGDETTRTFAHKIAEESGGWPFFVWELAQHLQEDPKIADGTLELDEVIWARVTRLPADTTRLLEQICVAGRPMPIAEVYQAMDAVSKGPSLLAHLRAGNLVRTTESDEDGTLVEAYHDRIRESVVNHLTEATVRGHHLNLARMIERVSGIKVEDLQSHINSTQAYQEPEKPYTLDQRHWQRVFDLAYFFDVAGEHQRALPYAVVAAERTRSQNALELAEQQYRIALRGAEDTVPSIRFRVAEGLGDVLNLRGRYDESREQYQSALSLAEDDAPSGRLEGKLGELAFKQGDQKAAMDHLEQGLAALGRQVASKSNALVVVRIMWELSVQIWHSLFPSVFVGRRVLKRAREDLVAIRFYNRLVYVYWFARGTVPTFWAQLRGMNLAECYPPTPELAQAYSLHAVVMAAVPYYSRAIAYGKRAEEISQQSNNLWAQGQTAHMHGIALFAASQWQQCIRKCEQAIELLEKAGDMWEANMARYHIADSLYHLGRLNEAIEQARQVYATGEEIGDIQSMGVILIVWAASCPRRVPVEQIQAERERPREDPLSTVQVLQAHGFRLLFHDDRPGEAAEWFQKALVLAKERGIKNTYIMWAYSWRTTCLRLEMERADEGSSARRSLFRQAKRAAKLALKMARLFQNDLPHALREHAMVAAVEGNESKARKLFDQSLAVAELQGAQYQSAKTKLARGKAGMNFGWPDAARQIAEGQAMIDSLEQLHE